jgi:hypothetical protein
MVGGLTWPLANSGLKATGVSDNAGFFALTLAIAPAVPAPAARPASIEHLFLLVRERGIERV